MANQDAIIEKIAKLLALANQRDSEAEAALAAEKVQQMLQDHNLSMSQVEAHGGNTDDRREKKSTGRAAMYKWAQELMTALAACNFCLHTMPEEEFTDDNGKHRRSKRHVLIGRAVNVTVTEMTYDYLDTTMRRLAKEAGYSTGRSIDSSSSERDYHYYLSGCSARLCGRLYEMRQQREQEEAERKKAAEAAGNGSHTELALVDVYGSEKDLNNDFINKFPPGTTAARRRAEEQKRMEREAKEAELVAGGMDKDEAFYVSHGYTQARAQEFIASWRKTEQRQRRNSSRSRGYTHSTFSSKDNEYYRKIRSDAYQQGKDAGDKISLDAQVGQSHLKRIK